MLNVSSPKTSSINKFLSYPLNLDIFLFKAFMYNYPYPSLLLLVK